MRPLSLTRSGKAAFASKPDRDRTEPRSTPAPCPSGLIPFLIRFFVCCMFPFTLGLAAFVFPQPAGALERWVVGTGGYPWKTVGTLEAADVVEGRLGPKETDPENNLALQAKVSSEQASYSSRLRPAISRVVCLRRKNEYSTKDKSG